MDALKIDAGRDEHAPLDAVATCSSESARLPRGTVTLALLFLIWLGLCDFAMVPLMIKNNRPGAGGVLALIAIGSVGAQVGVLAAWLVWGSGPYWLRVVTGWLVAAVLSTLLAAGNVYGFYESDRFFGLSESVTIALCWPLVSLAVEAPLWFLKLIFGVRVDRAGAAPGRSLAIRDLMLAMFVTAVGVTLARIGKHFAGDVSDAEYWGVIGVLCGSGLAVGLFMIPLLALVTIRVRSAWMSLALTVLVIGLIGALLPITLFLVAGLPAGGLLGLCLFFFLGATFATVLVFPFWLARRAGYRLQFGKSAA